MNWKLFIAFALLSLLSPTLSAQNKGKTPDQITRTNGKILECRITSVDSTRINLEYYSSGQKVESFLYLDGVSSYTYKGDEVFLHDIKPQDEEPEAVNNKEEKEKYDPIGLHIGDQPQFVARLSLLVPALVVEAKLSSNATLLMSAWTGFRYTKTTINGETTQSFDIIPAFTIGPRFYTTIQSREASMKRVDYYSSMYIEMPLSLAIDEDYNIVSFGVLVGFQRTLGRKGYWNIGMGLGIAGAESEVKLGPVGELGIGFILSK